MLLATRSPRLGSKWRSARISWGATFGLYPTASPKSSGRGAGASEPRWMQFYRRSALAARETAALGDAGCIGGKRRSYSHRGYEEFPAAIVRCSLGPPRSPVGLLNGRFTW